MIMSVRAKFKLSSIVTTEFHPNTPKSVKLVFSAQYDPSIPEDQRFQKATPWGQVEMVVDNPAALEQFTANRDYYFDITPVAAPE
jgi:hypothetical protein